MSLLQKIRNRRASLPDRPVSANIELTNRCNLKCNFCPNQSTVFGTREIAWETFERAVLQIAEYGPGCVVPVGLGEPLLYSRWEGAFRLIKRHIPGAPLCLTTNGVALTATAAYALCSILGPDDHILISLNAWDRETYRKMMGADAFDRVKRNIHTLIAMRAQTAAEFSIYVQIIRTTETEASLPAAEAYWRQHLTVPGDVPLYHRDLENWGGKIDTAGRTCRKTPARYPCLGLWSTIMIDVDGNVYPCCEALADRANSSLRLGNILDQTLADMLGSEKYRDLRALHCRGEWARLPECRGCDFWLSAPDVWFRPLGLGRWV